MTHMAATSEISILGTFAATLFALLNPLGMLPVFIGYTAGMRTGVQRWLAIFVSLTVLGLMLLFLFAGTALLHFFGITLDAFRIAGGILLLLIGIRTVAHDPANKAKDLTVASEVGELMEFWESFRNGTLDKPCDKTAKMGALGLPKIGRAHV